MPIYNYTAVDNKGGMLSASIVAADQSAAAASIIAKGNTPVSIVDSEGEGRATLDDLFRKVGIIRLRETTLFLRMMTALIASGITITEAIAVLHEQTTNRKFKYILGEIKMQIEGGVAFSDALGNYPRIFPDVAVNMIRAGEVGGILEDVLGNLVVYLEKKAALKKMLTRSFVYPGVILVVATVVVVFIVTFVIPRFTPILKGSARLPWNTQFLLDCSSYLLSNGIVIIMALSAGVAALITLFIIPKTREYIDLYKVHLPVFGLIFRLGVIVQFTRTFGSLLASGIPLVEALTTTNATMTNRAAKKSINDGANRVMAGEQLSSVIGEAGIFTSLMVSMVRIGEQSGNMDEAVIVVADIYEEQLEDRIDWISTMIEPMLIIFLGIIVGFVAWSLVAGMLSMYENMGS